jgi:BMFP domain-containing protein YqiC
MTQSAKDTGHPCSLREDYAALSEVVHAMHNRLHVLENRVRQLEQQQTGRIDFGAIAATPKEP